MDKKVSLATKQSGSLIEVTPDVACQQVMIVNLFFVGQPNAGDKAWALVDAGLFGSAGRIKRAAEDRYGQGARPQAIILTHGHFDHVGALEELATEWDVPVYAHELELSYLRGHSAYPPPDPSVGGGAMARLSWMYPKGPINLGGRVQPLPADGSVPGMPGWHWVHTPGHTARHVSFFRESDRTLIAGDAFVTVKQESALAVLMQRPEVNGPPKYYTSDWQAARRSVEKLADLRPSIVATGHGLPMRGAQMQQQLQELARDFDRRAVPAHGRYVGQPAITDERGVVSVPPPISDPLPKVLAGVGLAALAGTTLVLTSHRKATANSKRKRRSRAT